MAASVFEGLAQLPWYAWLFGLSMVGLGLFSWLRHRQPTIDGPALTGRARVVSLGPSGGGNNSEQGCKIGLQVDIPGLEPYEATIRRNVRVIHLPRVQPGETIPVRVAAADLTRIRLEFDKPITQ